MPRSRADATPPRAGRPRPWSVSGVFPSPRRLARWLPVLEGVELPLLLDLPAHQQRANARAEDERGADGVKPAERDLRLEALALQIIEGTQGQVDPRNVMGAWDLAARYELLAPDAQRVLQLTPRGRRAARRPEDRALGLVAGREGLVYLLCSVAGGATTLAKLIPGWQAVLRDNPRFAAPASWPRSLGQRVAALVHDGWLEAHGDHATRLAEEGGFRGREPEPAFVGLEGGLSLTDRALACPAVRRALAQGS
jgi:hypothetical protein